MNNPLARYMSSSDSLSSDDDEANSNKGLATTITVVLPEDKVKEGVTSGKRKKTKKKPKIKRKRIYDESSSSESDKVFRRARPGEQKEDKQDVKPNGEDDEYENDKKNKTKQNKNNTGGDNKEDPKENPRPKTEKEKFTNKWKDSLVTAVMKEKKYEAISRQVRNNINLSENTYKLYSKIGNDNVFNKNISDLLSAHTNETEKNAEDEMNKHILQFHGVLDLCNHNETAKSLIQFIFMYEDIILSRTREDKKFRQSNQYAITTYYMWNLDKCIKNTSLSKMKMERLIVDRFIKGSWYIYRVINMLRKNYIKDESKFVYFQDIILDTEYRNMFIDTIRIFHSDNMRKVRRIHRSLVDLKSAMFNIEDNMCKMAQKVLKKETGTSVPQINLIAPENITEIANFLDIVEQSGEYIRNNRSMVTVFMLFDATLVTNRLETRDTFRNYRNNASAADSNKDGTSPPILDQAAYINACTSMIQPVDTKIIGYEYKPLLKILSLVNMKLYILTSRAATKILACLRHEYNQFQNLDFNDALEIIVNDDYARSVFCELVGQEEMEEQGQTYKYLTKIQLHMAVRLGEQHITFLSQFLCDKLSGL